MPRTRSASSARRCRFATRSPRAALAHATNAARLVTRSSRIRARPTTCRCRRAVLAACTHPSNAAARPLFCTRIRILRHSARFACPATVEARQARSAVVRSRVRRMANSCIFSAAASAISSISSLLLSARPSAAWRSASLLKSCQLFQMRVSLALRMRPNTDCNLARIRRLSATNSRQRLTAPTRLRCVSRVNTASAASLFTTISSTTSSHAFQLRAMSTCLKRCSACTSLVRNAADTSAISAQRRKDPAFARCFKRRRM
mmetsp:Transcript_19789/g.49046  ORF Transcript_19789/g.49046 Transcript_19789/m.49046 type:complete len:260 (+) Transcript_19789:889-1668(+)